MIKNTNKDNKSGKIKLKDIKSVKIGKFEYRVYLNKRISDESLGEIHYSSLQIRLNRYSDNKKIKKVCIIKTLLHEIVHGIDLDVKFTKKRKSKEDNTDFISSYIIENIKGLVKKDLNFKHFMEYINECEIDIDRERMTFSAILRMLNDNKRLSELIKKYFKEKND